MDDLTALLPLAMPWALAIVLAMARAIGFVLGLPHMMAPAIPRQVQAIAVLALSIGLVGADPVLGTAITSLWQLAALVLGEFAFGLGLGFVIHLALATVRSAGELIGVEMGLSFAAVADPTSQGQSTAAASLLAQLGVQLFLVLGLERDAIRALALSLRAHPLGTASLDAGLMETLVSLLDRLFAVSVSFALPVVAMILCLKLAMAMLSRVAPKLQIFSLSFGLSIAVGLVGLHLCLPPVAASIGDELRRAVELVTALAQAS